jgi:hypothetical protein
MALLSNKKIIQLYVYGPQNRNVWIALDGGTGWKPLCPDHDCQSEAMAVMAAHARDDDRPVTVYEENGQIKYMYVF